MKVKLIDFTSESVEETYGTCELCMSTGFGTNERFKFEDQDTGEKFAVDGYYWDWGDKWTIYIGNVADFAAWLNDREVPDIIWSDPLGDFNWLRGLVDTYQEGEPYA